MCSRTMQVVAQRGRKLSAFDLLSRLRGVLSNVAHRSHSYKQALEGVYYTRVPIGQDNNGADTDTPAAPPPCECGCDEPNVHVSKFPFIAVTRYTTGIAESSLNSHA